jgi:hypothetical protein
MSCLVLPWSLLSWLILSGLVLPWSLLSWLILSGLVLSGIVFYGLSCSVISLTLTLICNHTFGAALVSSCASCSFTTSSCNARLLYLALMLRSSCSLLVYEETTTTETIRRQQTKRQSKQVRISHGVLPRALVTPSPLPAFHPTTKHKTPAANKVLFLSPCCIPFTLSFTSLSNSLIYSSIICVLFLPTITILP